MKNTTASKSEPTSKSGKPTPATSTTASDKARANALAALTANAPEARPAKRRPPTHDKPSPNKPTTPTPLTSSKARTPKTSATTPPTARLSALDAAAQVLSTLPAKEVESGLSAPELIDRMATSGLWTSPGGKTPAATLYAAMIREIATKGDASRFMRLEAADGRKRGRFATPHASSNTAAPKRSAPAPRPAKPSNKTSIKPAGTKPAKSSTKPTRKGGA